MDLLTLNFYSAALNTQAQVTVCIPSLNELDENGQEVVPPYKCLTLLHGMQGDSLSCLRYTQAEIFSRKKGVALVMPSFLNSYAQDLKYHLNFKEYLTQELPNYLAKRLNISTRREDNYIAGLSMGGFSALDIAIKNPQSYCFAASLSGALEPSILKNTLISPESRHALKELCGERDLELLREDDVLNATNSQNPRIYLACGLQDIAMLEINRKFKTKLLQCGFSCEYEEWNGAHDWEFWNTGIKKVIDKI